MFETDFDRNSDHGFTSRKYNGVIKRGVVSSDCDGLLPENDDDKDELEKQQHYADGTRSSHEVCLKGCRNLLKCYYAYPKEIFPIQKLLWVQI